MKDLTAWVLLGCTIVASGIVIVALAAVGEPQSVWLICNVIGMEVCP